MARTSGSGAKAPRETHRTASMADVAREAGVSQQTVSRVVNGQPNVSDLTRKRVNDAIVRLGFRPNYAGTGRCVTGITARWGSAPST